MTLNGLTINDRVILRFKANCRATSPERAKRIFFSDLRQVYNLRSDIVPQLPALHAQLATWAREAQDQHPEAA